MWLLDQFLLYKTFKSGRLLKVINTPLPFWFCIFNPWAAYAKAAAHGALGDIDQAKAYCRWLFAFYPYRYIRDELLKYIGVSQPLFAKWIIEHGVSRDMRCAYEMVTTDQQSACINTQADSEQSELSALIKNRTQAFGPARLESLLNFIGNSSAAEIKWLAEPPFHLTFKTSKFSESHNQKIKISVLVTAFNCKEYIHASVQSLLAQSHANIEILIVNDGSTDGTGECLNDLQLLDSRIRIFHLPENIGTYAAKSLMLNIAQGEYVVCHDADDLACPVFIERSLSALRNNTNKIGVISDWFRVDKELRIYPGAVRRFWPILSMNHSSLMLPTSVLREVGGWDVPRVAADTELFERIKAIYGHDSVIHLKEPLTIGSFRNDSLMTSKQVGAVSNDPFLRRIKYREAWLDWHQACKRKGIRPIMASPFDTQRPFEVPPELRVDPMAIQRCHNAMLKPWTFKTC